jgi:hypothetical protein
MTAVKLDEDRVGGVRLQLAAQVQYVHVDGTVEALEVITYCLLDKLRPAENPARFLDKDSEQLEFHLGQVEQRLIQISHPLNKIDGQPAVPDFFRSSLSGKPPENGPYPGGEFPRAEGLGHVIIGAYIQTGQLVLVSGHRCQHDDRHVRFRPQSMTYLQAAHPREHQVENDKVGPAFPGKAERLEAVESRGYPVAVPVQVELDQLDRFRIVIDY